MVRSEALAAAQKKYEKKIKTFAVRLHIERDADVVEKLENTQNKTEYIRDLIRKDMEGKR